jgi:hypothetical protein
LQRPDFGVALFVEAIAASFNQTGDVHVEREAVPPVVGRAVIRF